MALFVAYPGQMEVVRLYRIYCVDCKKTIYSNPGESRYDVIQRLQKAGWQIHSESPSKFQVLCPKCKLKHEIDKQNYYKESSQKLR